MRTENDAFWYKQGQDMENWAVQPHQMTRGKLNQPLVIDRNNK